MFIYTLTYRRGTISYVIKSSKQFCVPFHVGQNKQLHVARTFGSEMPNELDNGVVNRKHVIEDSYDG